MYNGLVNWLLFALISISSISIANLFQKLAMKEKESDPIISSIIFQFLLAIFTGIFALAKGFTLPPKTLLFPYFAISSLLYALGTLSFFKSIKIIEASEMTILTGFGAIVTIVTAYFFLGERLSSVQFLGVFAILTSVVIINYEGRSVQFNQGAVYAILGTSLYGLAVTNDTFVIKAYEATSYTPIISLLPGLILCVLYPQKIFQLITSFKGHINKNLGIYSFLYGIQAVSFYLALEKGALASQMNTIFKTEIVLTVILASIYLGERRNILRKVAAAILTTLGVLLIA